MKSTRPGAEADGYLLGCRDEELQRLAIQHRVWSGQAWALWSRAGFRRGATLLDLGCGPGFTTLDLARLVGPTGRVVAVDSSSKFLDHLQAGIDHRGIENVDVVRADACELDLEPECIDGAYARWLFCFLDDPGSAVRRVSRALRRGAALAVTDYFNYRAFTFAPRSDVLDRIVVAVQECWRRSGGDLEIQGRMPGIMRACGLGVTEVSQVCRVAEPGSAEWNWPRSFFGTFMSTLEEAGLTTPDDRRAFDREWEDRGRDPSSRLFLPPQIDVIGVKR